MKFVTKAKFNIDRDIKSLRKLDQTESSVRNLQSLKRQN